MINNKPEVTNVNLLPCPLCGSIPVNFIGTEIFGHGSGGWSYTIKCIGCNLSISDNTYDNPIEVVVIEVESKWNNRVQI